MKIAILGGDKREEVLLKSLAKKGYSLTILSDYPLFNAEGLEYTEDLKRVLTGAEVVIAPMSSTDAEGNLKATFVQKKVKLDEDFFALLPKESLFIIGIAVPKIKSKLREKGIHYFELARLEELAILNAIPTAEGAIKIAIEETDFTIFGSKVLVLGLGKVGLTLAWRLKALGAQTYAATRSRGPFARGQDLGLEMLDYQDLNAYLPEMNIIFNTVPSLILKEAELKRIKKDALLIELASAPGGIDLAKARALGLKSILAPGLPGKIAPQTAGEILAKIIPRLIEKRGLRRC